MQLPRPKNIHSVFSYDLFLSYLIFLPFSLVYSYLSSANITYTFPFPMFFSYLEFPHANDNLIATTTPTYKSSLINTNSPLHFFYSYQPCHISHCIYNNFTLRSPQRYISSFISTHSPLIFFLFNYFLDTYKPLYTIINPPFFQLKYII